MKQHILLCFLLLFVLSARSQTVIPLPGFQAVLKEFPTMSGDTITATFSITDFSNQWKGQDLNGREHLVLWRNCKRYVITEVVLAFSTQITVKMLKEGNPNLLPGVCALLQETPGQMVSHLISGITDSDKQCIDSYYRVDAMVEDTSCCWDSIFISLDSIGLLNGTGKISIADILNKDSIYVNALGDTVFMKYAQGFVKLPQYDLSVINKDFFWYSNGSTGVLWNKAVPDIDTITSVKVLATDGDGGYDWYSIGSIDTIVTVDSTVVVSGTGINVVESPDHTFTVNNTAPDQTVTITDGGIVDVSGTYPNFTISATEVDGSTTNELQTISTSGTAGNITLSNGGGTLNLNVNDADSNPTNEIQTIDTFSIVSNQLRLSLTQDNQAFKFVDLNPYINTDNQTLSRTGLDLSISGGNTITFPTANAGTTGWLSNTDWTTFMAKPSGTGAANKLTFWTGANTISYNNNFHIDNTNSRIGINTSSPAYGIDVVGGDIQVNGARIGLGGGSNSTNIAFGANALQSNTVGTLNVAVGQGALQSYTGNLNVAVGWSSQNTRTSGGNNLSLGSQSMRFSNTGSDNVAVGAVTMPSVTGSSNVAVGAASGAAIGAGSNNIMIGGYSGSAITTGSNNTYVGHYSGAYNTTGSGNICVGYFSGYLSNTSNILSIDNTFTTTPLFGGQFDNNRIGINNALDDITKTLDINGDLRIRNLTTTNPTKILGGDNTGVVSGATLGTGLSFSGTTLNVADQSPSNELITAVTSMGLLSGGNTIVITEAGVSWTGIIPPMTGATGGAPGIQGVVPAPSAGQNNHFLRGDGTWQTISSGVTGSGSATQIAYWSGGTSLTGNSNLYWNNGSVRMGIGTSGPTQTLHLVSPSGAYTSTKGLLLGHGSASQGLFMGHTGSTQVHITMDETNMFGNNGIYINSNGSSIGVKTPSATRDLDVNGSTRIRGALYDSGDSPGTAGQVPKSNGASAWSWGDNCTVDIYTTPGTYSWTLPANCKAVYVKVIGAGGGGAGGDKRASGVFAAGGAGGDGGGLTEWTFRRNELYANNTVTVGAGGTGGTGATSNNTAGTKGTDGGFSSFVNIVAEGGRRGDPTLSKLGYGVTDDGAYGAYYQNETTPIAATTPKVAAGGGGGGGSIKADENLLPVLSQGTTRLFTGAFPSPNFVGAPGANGGAASTSGNGTTGSAATSTKFGGGGGGGGAARNSVGNAGNGGAGGDGAVLIITYF